MRILEEHDKESLEGSFDVGILHTANNNLRAFLCHAIPKSAFSSRRANDEYDC